MDAKMEDGSTIYQANYDSYWEKINQQADDLIQTFKTKGINASSHETTPIEVTYVPIFGIEKRKQTFLALARQVSETMKLNADFIEYRDYIECCIKGYPYFYEGADKDLLVKLIETSDNMSIWSANFPGGGYVMNFLLHTKKAVGDQTKE